MMSNRMVFKQSLDDMKNQFVLLQVNGLDHGVNHRKQKFFVAILNHIHIITTRNNNLVSPFRSTGLPRRKPAGLRSETSNTRLPAEGLKSSLVYFKRPPYQDLCLFNGLAILELDDPASALPTNFFQLRLSQALCHHSTMRTRCDSLYQTRNPITDRPKFDLPLQSVGFRNVADRNPIHELFNNFQNRSFFQLGRVGI